ncbi:MAG TPA: S8 family serine peptidase [Polyangiaceae bacterium LLY-WYZ-15_(1-7)]|nr:S8 family serine peptidase [Polyangiaceae bacterium LLY-WYZ-15_(1-7)]HJL04387.1 S8 family serine peptidase [Polyangiaceae bacterium LLY-WYZ-15_(1-7)]HJL11836.1 S8 family serine peptidase [Polyangiaceae bacterium LLY-WYZ-15_(1-7)]HJL25949.1 S8 family serine peptidase [Polyangiaceae bacterium LLY-WYZ-15_(1-7)]
MRIRPLAFALLVACGGASAPPETTTTPEPAPAPQAESTETEAPPEEADPWAELEGEALRDYVRERAWAKLAEVQPELTPEALEGWLEDAEGAPALSGKAVERLMELALVAVTADDPGRAQKIVAFARAKARNRNQAFAGNTVLAEAARRAGGEEAQAAIAEVFRALPRSRFGSATVVFQLFQTPEQLTAQLGQIHGQLVSLETASAALFFEQFMPPVVEARATFLAAIGEVQAALGEEPEAYEFGTVDLEGNRRARPVRVAVWDVGTNPALFEDQLFTNPNEEPNGEDDDGNGLVDDVHGVVQDAGEHTHMELLYEPAPEVIEEYGGFLRGIMDLRAGMASTEAAQQVLALMRAVTDPEELETLETSLDAIGEWAHGTHVAGIMLAGLPQAELAIFRSAWAGEARLYHHRGPTDEELAAERANVEAIAAFIRAHEIRVVNASLGFGEDYVASQLRHERDRYATDEAVRERAAAVQAHRAETWRQVFAACPDTLFVVAAGNSNRDIVEYGDVPASLEAENLVVVGAVNRFGEWATFTNSNPERVRIFDWGVAVPSLVPSGETVPLSGTSMASPNVANAAAKVLALNPDLTPAEVIALLEETGDPIAAPFDGRIVNEVRALRQARRRR